MPPRSRATSKPTRPPHLGTCLCGDEHRKPGLADIASLGCAAADGTRPLQSWPSCGGRDRFLWRSRVPALARQAVWRDIGAAAGPLAGGFLFPILPAMIIYAAAAALFTGASVNLIKPAPGRADL